MNPKILLALMAGWLSGSEEGKITIPSHVVKTSKQHTESSKQKLKKIKGKKARTNRGKKRK